MLLAYLIVLTMGWVQCWGLGSNTFSLGEVTQTSVNRVHECVLKSLQSCSTLCNPMDCVAYHPPLSMGFSRQEYWNGLPCPPPGDLPDPGMELVSLMSPALASEFFTTSTTWEAQFKVYKVLILYIWYIYKLQNDYHHLIQWTWIWANSRRQRRTGKPDVLQSRRSQRVGHNLATEQQKLDLFHPIR